MAGSSELVRGTVAVLAAVLVVVGLIGFGTSITDPDALLRSTLAAGLGTLVLSLLVVPRRARPASSARSTLTTRN
ncbi:MAG TPA: hypothetical protein VK020_01720 [Microlunatus sp.]|nr:hypothetical protein [Microlunatus sp.]